MSKLHHACYKGDIDEVQLLIESGTDINNKNNDGDTPLFMACYHGYIDIVKLLIDNGATDLDCFIKEDTIIKLLNMGIRREQLLSIPLIDELYTKLDKYNKEVYDHLNRYVIPDLNKVICSFICI